MVCHKFYCLECRGVYKELPSYDREMGGYSVEVPECSRCGCDLFANLSDDTQAKPEG